MQGIPLSFLIIFVIIIIIKIIIICQVVHFKTAGDAGAKVSTGSDEDGWSTWCCGHWASNTSEAPNPPHHSASRNDLFESNDNVQKFKAEKSRNTRRL